MVANTDIKMRGKPKSGRIWKEPKERFKNVKKSIKGRTLEKTKEYRKRMKQIKEISRQLKLEKQEENKIKKMRREENAKRRLENERKSEVVQIIKNPSKIKKMRKTQLRQIHKRDTSQIKN